MKRTILTAAAVVLLTPIAAGAQTPEECYVDQGAPIEICPHDHDHRDTGAAAERGPRGSTGCRQLSSRAIGW